MSTRVEIACATFTYAGPSRSRILRSWGARSQEFASSFPSGVMGKGSGGKARVSAQGLCPTTLCLRSLNVAQAVLCLSQVDTLTITLAFVACNPAGCLQHRLLSSWSRLPRYNNVCTRYIRVPFSSIRPAAHQPAVHCFTLRSVQEQHGPKLGSLGRHLCASPGHQHWVRSKVGLYQPHVIAARQVVPRLAL